MAAVDGTAPAAYRRGVLLVVAAGVFWSSMGLGIRAMEVANVWQILFYRSLALAPFLFVVIAWRSGGRPWAAIRRAGLAGVLGGACLVVAFSGGILSVQEAPVANALFLFTAAPFFAAVLGRLILGETVRRATWLAMAVAAVGIVIMVQEGIALGYALGNAAGIATALGFALFTVCLRWKKLDDMMPAVFLAGIFATIVAGVICLTVDYPLVIPANDIALSAAMGVFQVGVGMVLYTIGSKSVPAAELALLTMIEVVLGPLWVWWLMGETATAMTLLGGAVLLLAIAGNAISGARRKPVPVM